MSSESQVKPRRLPNRIWLIVALFLFIVTFTHFVHPEPKIHETPFSNANLTPKNYLNDSSQPNPFPFCPLYRSGDSIGSKYGQVIMEQSRLHLGSGARVQRVINRALQGLPVTISVIGGSVSACHGAGDDPISLSCYPSRFFQWWNSVFPHPASELTNGAMRRTSSAYFGFCNAHHMPDVTDLVIIELDADDEPGDVTLDNFELLVRSILLRPDQPAVLILGHFSPQVHETYGFAGPDHWHNIVAQFYDVPHISTKALLYPTYMASPSAISPYYADPVLASPTGHALITDVLIHYFQHQTCVAWTDSTSPSPALSPEEPHGLFGGIGHRKDAFDLDSPHANRAPAPGSGRLNPAHALPPGLLSTRPGSSHPFVEVSPFCVSANDLINPLPPSLFYGSGWHTVHGGGGGVAEHYWYAILPTSQVRIPIVASAGDVGVFYVREGDGQGGSSVRCWVDDNVGGARAISNRGLAGQGEAVPVLEMIDHFVSRGSHFVECQLAGEEGVAVPAFKIVGIFVT